MNIWNHFKKSVVHDNRGLIGIDDLLIAGTLMGAGGGGAAAGVGAGAAAAGGASWLGPAIGAGAGLLGGLFGDEDESETTKLDYLQLPDYPEATGAREDLWSKLKGWSDDPYYGAIPQDWQDIWDLANKQIDTFYNGSPTTTGAYDKVKASAARRGVSDSPALQMSLGRVAAEQGSQVSDLAKQQAIAKAQFGEEGRKTFLSSLYNLAGMKPSFVTSGRTTTGNSGYGAGNAISDVGSAIGSYFTQQSQNDWWSNLLKSLNRSPQTAQFGIA